MSAPATASLRLVRAAVFGSVVLLLAVTAHVLGGGLLPGWTTLAVAALPVGCASVVLARRVRSLPALLATLVAGQVLLHEAFLSATAEGVAHGSALAAGAHAGHAAHTGHGFGAREALPAVAAGHQTSFSMIALHLLATAATAFVLARGEQLATRLWTWALAHLRRPAASLVVLPLHTRPARHAAQVAVRLLAASDKHLRGPPVRLARRPIGGHSPQHLFA